MAATDAADAAPLEHVGHLFEQAPATRRYNKQEAPACIVDLTAGALPSDVLPADRARDLPVEPVLLSPIGNWQPNVPADLVLDCTCPTSVAVLSRTSSPTRRLRVPNSPLLSDEAGKNAVSCSHEQPRHFHPHAAPTQSADSLPWSLFISGITISDQRHFAVEFFAGSAGLTKALRERGVDAYGIDHRKAKLMPLSPAMLYIDLSLDTGEQMARKILTHPRLIYCHFSPPGETASRAREIKPGILGPQPVRSDDFPYGLPDLEAKSPMDHDRVTMANKLYALVASIAADLSSRGILWTIENSKSSIMWLLPEMVKLLEYTGTGDVIFGHCMHGGNRSKLIRLRCYPSSAFSPLAVLCDGQHKHAPWGKGGDKYATAIEAAFPLQLCSSIADCVLDHLGLRRAPPLPVLVLRPPNQATLQPQLHRVAVGLQPRGLRAPKLLPEFEKVVTIECSLPPDDVRTYPGHRWSAQVFCKISIPKDAVTLRAAWLGDPGLVPDPFHDAPRDDHRASAVPLGVGIPPHSGFPGAPRGVHRASADPPGVGLPLHPGFPGAPRGDHHSSADHPGVGLPPHPVPPFRGCVNGLRHLELGDIYIGRGSRRRGGLLLSPSPWANPFKVTDCADVEEAIERFRSHLQASPALVRDLPKLAGMRLLCHCRVEDPCHGDAIISEFRRLLLPGPGPLVLSVGLPYSPEDFVRAASKCEHPFDSQWLSDPLRDMIFAKMSTPISGVVAQRRAAIAFWHRRAQDLEPRETTLHKAMSADLAAVLFSKKILVFKEMLAKIDFPNFSLLIDFFASGFPVTGSFPVTGIFPPKDRKEDISLDDLWLSASQVQRRIAASIKTTGDEEMDREIYSATVEEVSSGWLRGPFSPADLTKRLGKWIPSRRFGVKQAGKIRVIDDYTESGINSGLRSQETVNPGDLDVIAANARAHSDAFCVSDSLRTASSFFRNRHRHRDYENSVLVGRLWDLSKAYRQLARKPGHSSFTVVAVFNPVLKQTEYFEQPALAFGASASVLSFNWIAASLAYVLVQLLLVGATNFYDDFTVIEVEALAHSTTECVTALFSILGWSLKELPPFSSQPEPLGSVVDLRKASEGIIVVRNKEKRIADISAIIDDFLARDLVSFEELRSLRGRLTHARAQAFGRFGGAALRALGSLAPVPGRPSPLGPECRLAVGRLRRYLNTAPPRVVITSHGMPPLIFVDGSAEPCPDHPDALVCGAGGCILVPDTREYLYFGDQIPEEIVSKWQGKGSRQVISQAELLPVLISRLLFRDFLCNRSCIFFVDNESARGGLIKGSSPNPFNAEIVEKIVEEDFAVNTLVWYARVPSASNLADDPSRGRSPRVLPGWPRPRRLRVPWSDHRLR